jgi:prenyltransferase beta subunit
LIEVMAAIKRSKAKLTWRLLHFKVMALIANPRLIPFHLPDALQRYILICCQDDRGGLADKPGV